MLASSMYINSLTSQSSRRSMSSLLDTIANHLSNEDIKSHEDYDWKGFRYHNVHSVLAHLNGLERSPKTMNNYLSCMKGVAKHLHKSKVITSDDFNNIQEIKGFTGSHDKKGKPIELIELNKLLDHCLQQDTIKSLRDATIIAITYGSGSRRSEVANLTISSYDKDKGILTIKGKGNKVRRVELNVRVKDMLESWLDARGRDKGHLFTQIRKGDHITKNKISGQAVYNLVIERYKESGLKRLSPHDLRHTFATELLSNGVNIKIVQELLGHKNLETTANYLHTNEKAKNDASSKLPL
jgi:site-specific recombinase XerD